jgi:hypothetical protein
LTIRSISKDEMFLAAPTDRILEPAGKDEMTVALTAVPVAGAEPAERT